LRLSYRCALTAGLNRKITLLDNMSLVQGTRHNICTAWYSLVWQNLVSEKEIHVGYSNGVHVVEVPFFCVVILHM